MSKPQLIIFGICLVIIALVGGIYLNRQSRKATAQQNRQRPPIIEIKSGGGDLLPTARTLNENALTPDALRTRPPTASGPSLLGTISGSVRDEQERPIANAIVTLLQPPRSANRLQEPRPAPVIVDELGRYALDDIAYRGTVALCVRVEAAGYARRISPLHTFDDRHTSAAIDLTLSPAIDFKVQVMRGDKTPLEGALVKLTNPPELAWHGAAFEGEGICAADGISIFAELSPGELEILARAEGFAPQKVSFLLTTAYAEKEEPLVIVLEEGQWLAGRTIGDRDELLAGVRITLQDLGPRDFSAPAAVWSTTSDEQGRWRIEQLRAVEYLVTATYAPGTGNQLEYRRHFPAIRAPRDGMDIVFSLGGRLQGQVVSQQTGLPLPGVLITLELRSPPQARGARAITRITQTAPVQADNSGKFTIDGLPTGEYRLLLDAPAHRQLTLGDVRVTSPETTDLGTVTMLPGSGIMGRVIARENFEPLAEAAIVLRGAGFIKRLETDSLGRFQFFDLLAGNFNLTYSHSDFLEAQISDIFFAGDELIDLGDLYLNKGGAISGSVSDRKGSPLPEVRVRIDEVEQFPGSGAARRPKYAITDAAGRFSLIGLKPALYLVSCTLRVVEPTGNKGAYVHREIDLTESPSVDVRLVLEQDANLFISLATEDERPLTNSLVTGYFLLPYGAQNYMAFNRRPGQENELSLTDLSSGDYLILVSGDSGADQTLRMGQIVVLKAGDDNRFDFRLANRERQGLVTSAETGDPLPNCSLSFRLLIPGFEPDLDQSWLLTTSVETDAEGRFTIRGLQDQVYLISIRPRGAARRTDLDTINILHTAPGDLIEIRAPDRLLER